MAATSSVPRAGAAKLSDAVPRTVLCGDGFRGLGCVGVLVIHAAIVTMLSKHHPGFNPDIEAPWQYKPVVGVAAPLMMLMHPTIFVFFVLSGYLLSRGFLAAYLLGTPKPSISRYARNRVLRIVPGFWLVLAIFLTWDHAWGAGGAGGLLATFAFAQNYHSTPAAVIMQAWTLNVETAFYVALPIVAVLVMATPRLRPATPSARLRLVLGTLLVLFAASVLLRFQAGNPPGKTFNLGQFAFAFVPGIALAAIEPFAAPRVRDAPNGRRWSRGLLAAALAMFVAFVVAPSQDERILLESLGCGALVAAAVTLQWATGGGWRVLTNRAARWVGERSYGLYLIHLGLMGHIMRRIGLSHTYPLTFLALALVSLVVSLIAADLIWRFVERPALSWRLPWRQAEFAGAASPAADATPQPADSTVRA